jgi:hypothetical protein
MLPTTCPFFNTLVICTAEGSVPASGRLRRLAIVLVDEVAYEIAPPHRTVG